jgi:hypothetical protein
MRDFATQHDATTQGRAALPSQFVPIIVGCFLSGNDVSSEEAICLESIERLL